MDEVRSLSVVVTGGASGIGAATARRIVAAGGYAAILDLNIDAAEALAAQLGPHAVASHGDVLDEAKFESAHQAVASRLPPITGLVNCAGIAQVPMPIEEWPVDAWSRIMDSHLKGTYVACRVVGSAMAARGYGSVVNLSSVVGVHPGPVLAYGPAKAAVINMTQILAVQWARRGVRVNAVAPGWTDTPFLRPKERQGERDLTPIINATPMGRLMKPEELAEVIHFLLSPAASGVTGATVPCDGGVLAGAGWFPFGGLPQ